MKKFFTLFTDSIRELKSVKTLTVMAMLAAVAVILGRFSIDIGEYIRIGFSGLPNEMIGYLFGPVVGGVFAGTLDVIKFILKPTGPFCPQMTLIALLAGFLYGCFYYKKPITFPRVLIAKFTVSLICNVILNTLCLKFLYGKLISEMLPVRTLKNLIMWPIDSIIFYMILKVLERSGIFRMIKRPEIEKGARA